MVSCVFTSEVHGLISDTLHPVGTTIAAIISLLVCSGSNKVSTEDAFTLFENNTGW